MHRPTCEEDKTTFSNLEFEMVLRDWRLEGNHIYLNGFDVKNKSNEVNYHNDQTRDFQFIVDNFNKGDTILKKKGENFVKIFHGRDNFKLTYICENDIVRFDKERFNN